MSQYRHIYSSRSCPSDVNSNGGIDAGDILALLASFGCTTCGPSDVNGDGAVSVEDVLLVLSSFGEIDYRKPLSRSSAVRI